MCGLQRLGAEPAEACPRLRALEFRWPATQNAVTSTPFEQRNWACRRLSLEQTTLAAVEHMGAAVW